jgi:hypothetical protein
VNDIFLIAMNANIEVRRLVRDADSLLGDRGDGDIAFDCGFNGPNSTAAFAAVS